MSEENSKCGPGTHYDEETNSCVLDKVEEETVDGTADKVEEKTTPTVVEEPIEE